MKDKKIIEGTSVTLEKWLDLALKPKEKRDYELLDCQFATDEHLSEYLESISTRSEEEVHALLRKFLIASGHLGIDSTIRQWLLSMQADELNVKLKSHSYFRRLMDFSPNSQPWPNISWVLDLLPHYPQEAISALNAYTTAHIQLLPDGRLRGLSDAETIIRKKYLEHNLPVKETLLNLTPRDFELLVAALYIKKGYKVDVTPRQKDGGIDVIASKETERENEILHVECKRYTENVGVAIVRAVLGTLLVNQSTKAVIVTSSSFTDPAREEAKKSKRIELIGLPDFDKDMRKYISPDWTAQISRYIIETKKLITKCSSK